jgi:hypothetical protein
LQERKEREESSIGILLLRRLITCTRIYRKLALHSPPLFAREEGKRGEFDWNFALAKVDNLYEDLQETRPS